MGALKSSADSFLKPAQGEGGEAPGDPGRRRFLKAGLAATAALGLEAPVMARADSAAAQAVPAAARAAGTSRELMLVNVHTGEGFHGAYWHRGAYLPEAFASLKTVLRDHRTGERFPIDPRLMDLLYILHRRLENAGPFEVLSGYRSKATNASLRRQRHGAALHSLHMSGQACDIRLPGTRLGALHTAALRLRLGGVGFYPVSGFVHVDTGAFREWRGT